MDTAVIYDSIVITQNSYAANPSYDTCYKRGYYNITSYLLDDLVIRHPNLLHVFAAGNYQKQCGQGGYLRVGQSHELSSAVADPDR